MHVRNLALVLVLAVFVAGGARTAAAQPSPATSGGPPAAPPPSGAPPLGGGAPSNAPLVSVPAPRVGDGGVHFYGWQTFLAGGVSALIVAGGVALVSDSNGGSDGTLVTLGGGILYLSLPPTIQMFHEKPEKAVGSLLIEAGMPATGLFLGYLLGPRCEDACFDAPLAGFLTGLFVAPLVDGLLLGWEREGEAHELDPAPGPEVTVLPVVSPAFVGIRAGMTF